MNEETCSQNTEPDTAERERRAYIAGLLKAVNIQPPAKRIEKTSDIFPNGLPEDY